MRHQAEHGLRIVENARDIAYRTVRIAVGPVAVCGGIADRDTSFAFERLGVVIREVIAFVMGHWDLDDLAFLISGCEDRLAVFGT